MPHIFNKASNHERVYLENEDEGKFIIDLVNKKRNHPFPSSDKKERVVILLHGVTGNSEDPYMIELSNQLSMNGYNVIILCHYAPEGEKNLRCMNFAK